MTFQFSRQGLHGHEARRERILEMIPGAMSWTILLGMIWLSFWKPLVAAVLIIAFDLYWLLRLFYMTFFLVVASVLLSAERHTDWMARIQQLDSGKTSLLATTTSSHPRRSWGRRLSEWLYQREVATWQRTHRMLPRSSDLVHLILIAVVKESREVIEPGIARLAEQPFPPQQLVVVLAMESRAPVAVQAGVRAIQAKYQQAFRDVLVVVHPENLPGEARVKGANVTYAAKVAARYFREHSIPFEHVIVSCFDADTVVSPAYISALTYRFLVTPDRARASFQPIPVYHNNIWQVPGFARVLDIGSSFFQLIQATNPGQLVTFSSHSMSFQALVDVGYWPVDLISDDSAIFWKTWLHYEGQYQVIPLYVTVSMDVVAASSWWRTITNVYRQKRRWAWGVENFPIVVRGLRRARKIPFVTKVRCTLKLLDEQVSWATSGFLLTVLGWLPVMVAGREFSDSVLYYSAPRITAIIFQLASIALLTSVVLSFCLLPKPQSRYPLLKRMIHAVEWWCVPAILVFLNALPALDAQTRLLMGRYMEFWVTEKTRKPPRSARWRARTSLPRA